MFKNPRIFDEKWLSAERKTRNGRTKWSLLMTCSNCGLKFSSVMLVHLIKSKFLLALRLKLFLRLFRIILIRTRTNTRRCLAEPWAFFMSNVLIGFIWRNLIKKRRSHWRSSSTWYWCLWSDPWDVAAIPGTRPRPLELFFRNMCW
jgi:hypothetical protein